LPKPREHEIKRENRPASGRQTPKRMRRNVSNGNGAEPGAGPDAHKKGLQNPGRRWFPGRKGTQGRNRRPAVALPLGMGKKNWKKIFAHRERPTRNKVGKTSQNVPKVWIGPKVNGGTGDRKEGQVGGLSTPKEKAGCSIGEFKRKQWLKTEWPRGQQFWEKTGRSRVGFTPKCKP